MQLSGEKAHLDIQEKNKDEVLFSDFNNTDNA